MPTGTPELDAAWRAREAEIDELLEPFCDLCAGAGLSYRTIRKHPHVDWERYQLAGLRISSDRAFNTVASPRSTASSTDAAHKVDLHELPGTPPIGQPRAIEDDDYLAPPFQIQRPASTPERRPTARLPIFDGEHALELNYVAHALRKLYLRTTTTRSTRQP